MNLVDTIVLGVVQGLTEFLPISSTGHLILAQKGLKNFQSPGICLEVFLHIGTLLAILVFFRKDIEYILKDIFYKDKSKTHFYGRRWAFMIILASVPTVIIGILFGIFFKQQFTNVRAIGVNFIITGLLLWISDYIKGRGRVGIEGMKIADALCIGLVQGLALAPGISRSGSTITTGIFLGLDRDMAVRFSFLLSIPALFGAFFYELEGISQLLTAYLFNYLLGAIVAAVIGYLSILYLLKMVISKRLSPFAYYCWVVAFIGLFIL